MDAILIELKQKWHEICQIPADAWGTALMVICGLILLSLALNQVVKLIANVLYKRKMKKREKLDVILNHPDRHYYMESDTLKKVYETYIFKCHNKDGTVTKHEYIVKDHRK